MRGRGQIDLATLNIVIADFGWTVHVAHDLPQTAELVAPFRMVSAICSTGRS
jgi:hypothetical protein